jgi:hypothetical protein
MEKLDIRAYKVALKSGSIYFECKARKCENPLRFATIEELAEMTKELIETLFADTPEMSINLKPYNDIECSSLCSPWRCFPLTEIEADNFWNAFYK